MRWLDENCRGPGETLEPLEIEEMLTPIALQALRHFDIVSRNAVWIKRQTPGNFSSNEKRSKVARTSERVDNPAAVSSQPLRILEA